MKVHVDQAAQLVSRSKISMGDYWDSEKLRIKITLNQICKADPSVKVQLGVMPEYGADLSISLGGSLIYGGSATHQIGTNRLFLPCASDAHNCEQFSAYAFSFSEEHVKFVGVRVDHINPHTNEIDIMCTALTLFK
jgi:hypothetical protein